MANQSAEERQVAEEYQRLNKEQVGIMMQFYDIADEKRQHEYSSSNQYHRLVLETLKATSPDRRAWRMRNGILAEGTAKDVMPTLEQDIATVRRSRIE